MKKTITKQGAFGLLACVTFALSHAQTAYVAGPIERISHDSSQVTVLGQTYVVDTGTVIVDASKNSLRFSTTRAFELGSLVAIEAVLVASPAHATSVVVAKTRYVPGATPVFVGGLVQRVSTVVGTLRIGKLEIDISSISPDVVASIRVGSYLEICGIQPSPTGVLIAQALSFGSARGLATDSIAGTGKQSIAGTGTMSISGTGKQSIAGTGKQSIAVTGKVSIAGTGGP